MHDPREREVLVSMAEHTLAQAHAPWSGLSVGAVVLTRGGDLHAGCNVESAAFPLGGCAERHAIAAAVLAEGPGMEIVAVAIAARDAGGQLRAIPPCGACRQLIHEFGKDAWVGWRTGDGTSAWHAIGALLPEAFELPPG
ncbi:MAG: hypothetical protein A2X76_01985 [Lysobacterales bacterium GWF1_69_6]|nr:MAG: hypothetical protein A2X76_01985 [Xanthomonadales bacterium GWF1_69_6]